MRRHRLSTNLCAIHNSHFLRTTLFGLILLFGVVSGFAPTAWAHRVGNGGDHIRATFIKVGGSVLDYLKETNAGAKLAEKQKLSIASLESTLDIERISVTDQTLRDNSGSVVEALGEAGRITLQKEAWFKHFESDRDITYLVFHEMLRSAGVNDDNYLISASLNPFPRTLRVDTRVVPLLALIKEDNLSSIFQLSSVSVAGSGCPRDGKSAELEFNEEKNILNIRLRSYRVDATKGNRLGRKACALVLPAALPKGKQLVISQIDLAGKIELEAGSTAQLQFEAFLAGSASPMKTRAISTDEKTRGRILTRRTDVLRSRCGESDNVRLNTSLMMRGSDQSTESAAIDEISLFLTLEDCQS